MWYDPWLGWSFGYDYDWDWFNWGFGFGLGFGFGGWWGGWWGPMAYCPAYIGRGFARGGFYGRNGNLIAIVSFIIMISTATGKAYSTVSAPAVS